MKVKLNPMYDAYDFKPSTDFSAGIDLRVCVTTPITLNCSEELLLDTGVALEIPEGWFGMVLPRSSSGRKKTAPGG